MLALPVAVSQSDRPRHSSLARQRPKAFTIEHRTPNHAINQNPAERSESNQAISTAAAKQNQLQHWNFSDVPIFANVEQQLQRSTGFLTQAKLKVGPADSPFEREADNTADHIVGTGSAHSLSSASAYPVRASATHHESAKMLGSAGRPLDPETKAFMGSRFGYDFSQVRLHTDTEAAKSADEIDALAYTVGQQVVFAAGQYKPGTTEGRRLLAHELTHVVQQNGPAGQAASGTVQRTPRNPLDDAAKRIIEAAKDTSKATDQRAINAVNDIVRAYYDSTMVESVVYKEDEVGLVTTPIGKGRDIKGRITVGRDFVDHIDSFARRVLQVGHELEHVKQQREGMGGHNKSHEREFLAFYWESTQPEKAGTGRMPHSTRVDLIDEALRNYYCLSHDDQEKYASKKDGLLTLRSSEEHKGGHDHTDPPSSCPAGK